MAEAVRNVLGGLAEPQSETSVVRFYSTELTSLAHLRDRLRDRHVRAAARRLLQNSIQGGRTELMLNRQAAVAGVIAVCGSPDESPLGPIYLRLESDDLPSAIDWLTAYDSG